MKWASAASDDGDPAGDHARGERAARAARRLPTRPPSLRSSRRTMPGAFDRVPALLADAVPVRCSSAARAAA
jgi:hypothetical protein